MFSSIDKAFVPVIVMALLAGLGILGITGEMSVGDAVTALVTGFLVWAVPNRTDA